MKSNSSVKTVKKSRIRKTSGGAVQVRSKKTVREKRISVFMAVICIMLQLFIVSLCIIPLSLPSLWLETLIRPSFMPEYKLFLAVFAGAMLIMTYVPYNTFRGKNTAAYVSLIINYALLLMTFYMFFIFKSLLGGFVLIIVLIAQTASMLPGNVKKNRLYGLAVAVYIVAQCYFAALMYTFLMLN